MTRYPDLVEMVALAIYCDSYTQYGTCTPERWKKTSEEQREFTRSQARAAIDAMVSHGIINTRMLIP